MSIYLDVVCTDQHLTLPDVRLQKMRAIAEILPFVFAKYGIGQSGVDSPAPRNSTAPQARCNIQPRFKIQPRFTI